MLPFWGFPDIHFTYIFCYILVYNTFQWRYSTFKVISLSLLLLDSFVDYFSCTLEAISPRTQTVRQKQETNFTACIANLQKVTNSHRDKHKCSCTSQTATNSDDVQGIKVHVSVTLYNAICSNKVLYNVKTYATRNLRCNSHITCKGAL